MTLTYRQRIIALTGVVVCACSPPVATALTHTPPAKGVTPSTETIGSSTAIRSPPNRRLFLQKAATFASCSVPLLTGVSMVEPSLALDMEAFANSQLEADSNRMSTPVVSSKKAVLDSGGSGSRKGGGGGSSTRSSSSSGGTQMTEDEALCKFGQPSLDKGDACIRAGLPTKAKYEGGVDAFGKIDRGDFIRCKSYYEMVGDKYQKFTKCE